MKHLIIKSNSGNHSGFNVKWELIDICYNKEDVFETLLGLSFGLSDDHIIKNGRAYDPYNKEFIFVNGMSSFRYDGCTYTSVTEETYEYFFNGGYNGYAPKFVFEEFGIEDYKTA